MSEEAQVERDLQDANVALARVETALEPLLTQNMTEAAQHLSYADRGALQALTGYALLTAMRTTMRIEGRDSATSDASDEMKRILELFGQMRALRPVKVRGGDAFWTAEKRKAGELGHLSEQTDAKRAKNDFAEVPRPAPVLTPWQQKKAKDRDERSAKLVKSMLGLDRPPRGKGHGKGKGKGRKGGRGRKASGGSGNSGKS